MSPSGSFKYLWRAVTIAVLAIVLHPVMMGAVLVAPHAVFIDHRSRTGQITLANPGTEPEEVEIELKFGYPTTDSLGNPYVELIDDPGPDDRSAAEWIRAYPRRIRLEPGQRQVVRLLATPPADLADGEHWSRIIVTAQKIREAIPGDTGLRAGITFRQRTIISAAYRKGDAHTGVQLTGLRGAVEGDSLVAWIGLERTGNAAYLGSIHFAVVDESEAVVREWRTPVAVYHDINRRMAFPLTGLVPGTYRVRFELSTLREDIPQANVLPAASIARSFGIQIG
ncbi:MAG: hypothetical protein JSW51_03560 [Gemmatimonadota bacterium]|nr:MAG: hypothetical protein JSW51_03560 [Gemmatimonadota bacterium]